MSDAGMILAHAGHGSGGTVWLLIPLVIVGFLLWRSTRGAVKKEPPRDLGPRPHRRAAGNENADYRNDVEPSTDKGDSR